LLIFPVTGTVTKQLRHLALFVSLLFITHKRKVKRKLKKISNYVNYFYKYGFGELQKQDKITKLPKKHQREKY
jgi:ABC-type phosphate transport system ATPase subunit